MTERLLDKLSLLKTAPFLILALIMVISFLISTASFEQSNTMFPSPSSPVKCCGIGERSPNDVGTLIIGINTVYNITPPVLVSEDFDVIIAGEGQNISFRQLNGDTSINILQQGNYTVEITNLVESVNAQVKVIKNQTTTLSVQFTTMTATGSFFVATESPFTSFSVPMSTISVLAEPSVSVYPEASWTLLTSSASYPNNPVSLNTLTPADITVSTLKLVNWYQVPQGTWLVFSLKDPMNLSAIKSIAVIEQYATYEVLLNAT
ncbi:MAG: hypothetical protein QXV32_03105 [Conexivisphaerales archaeon]